MKRKRLDRDTWKDITLKRYRQFSTQSDSFTGLVSLLCLDKVSSVSRWHYADKPVTVCAPGMKWLQLIPEGKNYMITAMFAPDDQIELWYADLLADHGLCTDGVTWYDDLYLDVIVRPEGDIRIDDMDELEQAYRKKDITLAQFSCALHGAGELLSTVFNDLPRLTALCVELLHMAQTTMGT